MDGWMDEIVFLYYTDICEVVLNNHGIIWAVHVMSITQCRYPSS